MKGDGSVEEKLARFLLMYRITTHATTGIVPSELLMGCRLRSRLDLLYPELAEKVIDNQYKQKEHHDNSKQPGRKFVKGDTVYVC